MGLTYLPLCFHITLAALHQSDGTELSAIPPTTLKFSPLLPLQIAFCSWHVFPSYLPTVGILPIMEDLWVFILLSGTQHHFLPIKKLIIPREFSMSMVFMVWKLIKETSTKIGVRRACKGGSHTPLLSIHYPKQEEVYLASPIERCFPLYYHHRKKEGFLLTQKQLSQWETVTT